jgi:hypothetical protein
MQTKHPLAKPGGREGTWELVCPQCGEDTLHHDTVTVYARGEDAGTVVRTVIDPEGRPAVDVVRDSQTDNPSRRRHGLAIRFWCEVCGDFGTGGGVELTFAQHKGATQVTWRPYARQRPE